MAEEWRQLANGIAESNRALGEIAGESISSFNNGDFLSALSCLFVLVEESLKYAVGDIGTSKGMFQLAETALDSRIVLPDEWSLLDRLREYRNAIFHGELHSTAMIKDGLAWPLDEPANRKELYEAYATRTFRLILKLLSS